MAHTLGPWVIGQARWASLPITIGGKGELVAGAKIDDDARLIAAAPEAPHECDIEGCPGRENKRKLDAFDGLLGACKGLVKGAVLCLDGRANYHGLSKRQIDKALDAIAKAEG